MKWRISHLVAFAATFAVAAPLTAVAAAGTPIRPDDRAPRGVGAVMLVQATTTAIRPDDRAIHGVGSAPLARELTPLRPDDRATHGVGPAPLVREITPLRPDDRATRGVVGRAAPVAVPSATGFDWGDAGIGAFGGAVIALLLLGGAVLLSGRRPGIRVALR